MSTAEAVPRKKKSFLRRLSLSTSSSKPQAQVLPNHTSAHRSTSGEKANGVIPNGVPPLPRTNNHQAQNVIPGQAQGSQGYGSGYGTAPSAYRQPSAPVDEMARMAVTSPTAQATTIAGKTPSSPPQRGRIHPALASPPNSPPKRSSTTPYDTRHIVREDGSYDRREMEQGQMPNQPQVPSLGREYSSRNGPKVNGTAQGRSPVYDRQVSGQSQIPRQGQNQSNGSTGRHASTSSPTSPTDSRRGSAAAGPVPTQQPIQNGPRRSQSRSNTQPDVPLAAPIPTQGSRFVESSRAASSLAPPTAFSASMSNRSHSTGVPISRPTPEFKPPVPPSPPASAPPGRPRLSVDTAPMSEATKYALTYSRQPSNSSTSPTTQTTTQSRSPSHSTAPGPQRRVSRPLPRPPSGTQSQSPQDTSSLARSFPSFEFSKSPTIPQLVDPRYKKLKRPSRLTFNYVFSVSRIQRALLPYLNINSFLALLGTSDRVRKAFTGEMVGKWVLKEWGLKLDGERGRSWPNLTVWEGFLESQLHDPATYATYPAQWHKLLQHLCLSYSLIVLYLRSLPPSVFPPIEEEDDRPLSRAEPMRDRLVEIVMPSPLSGNPILPSPMTVTMPSPLSASANGKAGSIISRRRGSTAPGPPISYPAPKRYGFRPGPDGSGRSRRSSESRPGSIFSYQSTPSVAPSSMPRHRLIRDSVASDPGAARHAQGLGHGLGHGPGSSSHGHTRLGSPALRKVEPIFDRPPPYIAGRAAVLRVFVPLSEKVPRWPSAEGAFWTVKELEKCGAMKKLRLGDLVANTAIKSPRTTEHILLYVPTNKHLLVPLDYSKSPSGHIPPYIDSFTLPPLYYHPLLSPIIVHPNLARFASQAMASMRLAYDHRDVLVSTGRASAKRYIHVTGFEVKNAIPQAQPPLQGQGPMSASPFGEVAAEWNMVTLESEGTGEGKVELERRLGYGDPRQCVKGAWEVVREKSMGGTIWLRAV